MGVWDVPKLVLTPLVGVIGYWGFWLRVQGVWPAGEWGWSLGGPGVGAGLLVGGLHPGVGSCRAVIVLGLGFCCWWVESGSMRSQGWWLSTEG